ncbi:MAG: bifunctional 3,4-dihydroxy-2-butanone-4-phosphate synthase/GTP cyclohydrolase II [Verrucomicrobiota bacterium]|nr:bifunctional 3,4-dihydroxy-2-butanone-4-phosphate synthase/GTP cyclohydrolase II [Verrucomicrobiota bacterium]
MFNEIPEIIDALKNGEIVIITDDMNRENEGDLVMIAEKTTPKSINFMAKYGRGLICTPVNKAFAKRLNLPKMTEEKTDQYKTAFTVSVDASEGISTGISAHDRAKTILLLAKEKTEEKQLTSPGHVFPLVAREGGVLVRAGHTEATVDLARMADATPVGVICEIMNDDGSMARIPELKKFREKHNLKWTSIEKLIAYRRKTETYISKGKTAELPTKFGEFVLTCYTSTIDKKDYLALVYGDISDGKSLLVRMHSECLTGDVFKSSRCDCGEQLEKAMEMIVEEGRGIIVYLRQEGRGIGLANKVHAYHLQDKGLDTVEANIELGFKADLREYGIGAQILKDLGVKSIRLLTNNPKKVVGIDGYGIHIEKREPLICKPQKYNKRYLDTKKEKLGHILPD